MNYNIKAWRKTSFIDYPNKISSVLFLGDCNFTCEWCHNKKLNNKKDIDLDEILLYIYSHNMINGIVISGGEPTFDGCNLINLINRLKVLQIPIKLDTNGSNPEILKYLIKCNLVQYIAMDIKFGIKKYSMFKLCKKSDIKKSIKIISTIEHEFRTTVNKHITKDDIIEIDKLIKDSTRYLQKNIYMSNYQNSYYIQMFKKYSNKYILRGETLL